MATTSAPRELCASDIGIRDGSPAVNVKDDTVWAIDARTAHFYDDLSEQTIGVLYESTAEDFWHLHVPTIAQEHGYEPDEISQDGRSGGWLTVSNRATGHFLEYLDGDDPWSGEHDADDAQDEDDDEPDAYVAAAILARDRFLDFARAILDAVDSAGEEFVYRLTEAADDLNARRELCIVRGEN